MTAEMVPVGAHDLIVRVAEQRSKTGMNARPNSLLEYPACGGKPASTPNYWVPIDWLNFQISRVFHITDEDLKKKSGR